MEKELNKLLQLHLHIVALSGDVDKVRELLEGGECDVNCVDKDGWTPLHEAASEGHLGVVRVLLSEFKANVIAHTDSGETPLHCAAKKGHLDVVRVLVSEFKANVNAHTDSGETPLHCAAKKGHLDVVRVLVLEFKALVNAYTNHGETPLHLAASGGHLGVVRVLVSEFKAYANAHTNSGETPLHRAAERGHVDVARVLLKEYKAKVNARTNGDDAPLHLAASGGHLDVVRVLISKFKAKVDAPTKDSEKPLHLASKGGHLGVVKVLISEFKADVNALTDLSQTPMDMASSEEVAVALMKEFHCDTKGGTPYIHTACERGWVNFVRALVQKHGTDILKNVNRHGDASFDVAVNNHREEVAVVLMNEFHCDTKGGTPYIHTACERGWVNLVRALVQKHGTGILNHKFDMTRHVAKATTTTTTPTTPLYYITANTQGHEVAVMLSKEFGSSVKDLEGRSLLHIACKQGDFNLVCALISDGKADITATDNKENTCFDEAVNNNSEEVALALMNEFHCDTKGGTPYIHTACKRGWINLVRALVQKHGTHILKDDGNIPIDVAVNNNRYELALALMNEFHCDTNVGTPYIHRACERGWVQLIQALIQKHGTGILNGKVDTYTNSYDFMATMFHYITANTQVAVMLSKEFGLSVKDLEGRSLLHLACKKGDVSLVRALINDGKADVIARDGEGNTPLHVAALSARTEVVNALIKGFGCDVHVTGHLGRSLLHSACTTDNGSLVMLVSQHISPWVADDNGDTPLHICARLGNRFSVGVLLELNPPVLIRNNFGKTPRDLEVTAVSNCIDVYMKVNKDKIYSQYEVVQRNAKRKYSLPEPITRAFVVGNSGAGKSSLVEALKREGLLDSFKRVSESSVPPHTAGIVPSIHTSKHYGRVLFYDFAGDAEYYSSHAAILENLASSRKGNNVFLLVIDMREEMAEIKKTFHYWLSFIQHQQFHGQKSRLIVVGSHLDLLTRDVAKKRGKELQIFCDGIDTEDVQMSAHFMLDCCKPKSKQIVQIQTLMRKLTEHSSRFKLSLQASILLGLLDKDFSNVPACSIKTLLGHIEETGIEIPTDPKLLHPLILELHDLGLLFLVESSNRESSSVVLNMSQLTNIVHKSLFSEEGFLKASFEKKGLLFSFSAGIVPQGILDEILPENITKECLVQLQYCQEISHAEAHVFPSLKVSDSTDQSFLFFPALCSADKSEVEWVTPPDLCYGIGWLARCTDPCDYLSPRFHHVLMLRLIFKFTLSARPPADKLSSGSPDLSHFQRRCTVWKTGVHWLMKEGVECMVELAGANREVVVLTRSTKHRVENCAAVFNDIVSCVMETKAEFCHSVRLEFFLLDSTSEVDYLSANNLFDMRDVEEVLASADEVVVSVSGKRQMERSKLLCLRYFTLWYSLFPMDFKSVLHYIKNVVRELYMLGLHLGIPKGILDAIEADNRTDVCKMRRELVKGWMSSSLEPPCWWHLVNSLRAVRWSVLAEEIATEFGKLRILSFI